MKKNIFKFIGTFLIAIMLLTSASSVNFGVLANVDAINDFWIAGTSLARPASYNGRLETDRAKWWFNVQTYYLMIPNSADEKELTVYFNATNDVTVRPSGSPPSERVTIESGETTNVFENAFANGKIDSTYIIACGSREYTVRVRKPSNIGSMFIATSSGNLNDLHASKDNREAGQIVIIDNEGRTAYNGGLRRINGRGNATWQEGNPNAKKPYNIRLDSRVNLFGMGSNDRWSLMSNPFDGTHLQDTLSSELARQMGIDYVADRKYVDLYINNNYMGMYTVATQTRIDASRVNIVDLEASTRAANGGADLETFGQGYVGSTEFSVRNREDFGKSYKYYNIPNDPADITGGYLLEFDLDHRWAPEASGFISNRGQTVVIKYPEFASKAQVEYIREFFQDMEDAVYSPAGINGKGKHYSEYINEESFAKMYVLHEYAKNLDVAITSFFLTKDTDTRGDGKLHCNWPWDFDNAYGDAGPRDGHNLSDPYGFWASEGRIYEHPDGYNNANMTKHLIAEINKYDDFQKQAQFEYYDKLKPALENTIPTWLENCIEEIHNSAVNNDFRWYSGDRDFRFNRNINRLANFMAQRKIFLENQWNSQTLPVYHTDIYVSFIDGDYIVKSEKIPYGGSVTPPPNNFIRPGYILRWSDTNYTNITKHTVFYAIWDRAYKVTFLDRDRILNEQEIAHGGTATEPAHPTRNGYIFNGWDRAFNFIADHTDIYARWTLIPPSSFTVTFLDNKNTIRKTTIASGRTTTSIKAPAKKNHVFIGWYTNSTLKTKFNFKNGIKKNTNIFAKYAKIPSVPSKVKASKVKKQNRQARVDWIRIKGATYEIIMSTSRTKGYGKPSKTNTNSFTRKNLRKSRTYYFKVRSVIRVDGNIIRSKYSNPARIKL